MAFTNLKILPNQTGELYKMHKNSNVQFTLTDSSGTGVDSTSITVGINDSTIVADDADQTGGQVQILSHSSSCTILYDPVTDFTPDSVVTVSVRVNDLAETPNTLDEAEVTDPDDLEVYYFLTSTGEWSLLNVTGYDDTCIQVKVIRFCYLVTGKSTETTTIQDREKQMPDACILHQNHPNPFNPETTISYTLSKPAQVTLTVYNLIGQPVRILVNRKMSDGTHQVTWNAKNDGGQTVPSGIYIYILKSGSYSEMQKMLLMK